MWHQRSLMSILIKRWICLLANMCVLLVSLVNVFRFFVLLFVECCDGWYFQFCHGYKQLSSPARILYHGYILRQSKLLWYGKGAFYVNLFVLAPVTSEASGARRSCSALETGVGKNTSGRQGMAKHWHSSLMPLCRADWRARPRNTNALATALLCLPVCCDSGSCQIKKHVYLAMGAYSKARFSNA